MHRFRSRTWSLRTAQQRQQCPAVRLGGIRMLEGEFVAEHLDLHDERIPFPAQHPEGAAQQGAQLLLVREPDGLGESDGAECPYGRAVECSECSGAWSPCPEWQVAHHEEFR